MPKAKSHVANNAVRFAETLQEKLEQVPGDRTAFLRFRRKTETFALFSYLINDPSIGRLNSPLASSYESKWIEVGTYRKGVSQKQLVEDINEAMSRA